MIYFLHLTGNMLEMYVWSKELFRQVLRGLTYDSQAWYCCLDPAHTILARVNLKTEKFENAV